MERTLIPSISIGRRMGYGYLYNHHVLTDPRGIVNGDWRIPTLNDVIATRDRIYQKLLLPGGVPLNKVAAPMKSIRRFPEPDPEMSVDPYGGRTTQHPFWVHSTSHNPTNSSKLSILPAGLRNLNGNYQGFGGNAIFWTIDQQHFNLGAGNDELTLSSFYSLSYGLAVRAVYDLPESVIDSPLYPDFQPENNGYVGNNGLPYPIVKIGAYMWTMVNLAETHYNNAAPVNYISGNAGWESAGITEQPAFCAVRIDRNLVGRPFVGAEDINV